MSSSSRNQKRKRRRLVTDPDTSRDMFQEFISENRNLEEEMELGSEVSESGGGSGRMDFEDGVEHLSTENCIDPIVNIGMKINDRNRPKKGNIYVGKNSSARIMVNIGKLVSYEERDSDSDIKKVIEIMQENQLFKLSKWLSPLEPQKRHQDIKRIRCNNTGSWLLEHECFLRWLNSGIQDQQLDNGPILCCYGIPGAGKTVLSSLVIDYTAAASPEASIGSACVYCDYRDQANQTCTNILNSFLCQFLSIIEPIPEALLASLTKYRKERKNLEKKEAINYIIQAAQLFHRSFICIDALDELIPQSRKELLESIKQLLAILNNNPLQIFITARPIIQAEVERILNVPKAAFLEIVATEKDIREYLIGKLNEDPYPEAMNEKFKDEVISKIINKSQGMFLLPVLHIQSILEQVTLRRRQKALSIIPNDISSTFDATISRIKKASDLGMQVLTWIHLAKRPLKIKELLHALSVSPGDMDLDEHNIPDKRIVLDLCLGLVTIDEETSTVRLCHYLVEEFLHKYDFTKSNCLMAQACLTYITFRGIGLLGIGNKDKARQAMVRYPFLEYAVCNWGYYLPNDRQCCSLCTNLALKLLKHPNMHYALQILELLVYEPKYFLFDIFKPPQKFTGLHATAYFGVLWLITELEELNWDRKAEGGYTPLLIAAQEGHEAIVELLLTRKEVNVNSHDKYQWLPLSYAAQNGHETVVRLLLAHEKIMVNCYALENAAGNGHEAIVRLLLAHEEININCQALSNAARNGHEAIVQLLLAREEINVNFQNKYGQSALSYAIENGHEAIVKLLLAHKEINVNSKDMFGQVPLLDAAENRHEAIVKHLLTFKEINVNHQNVSGASPLSYAAKNGHTPIAQLLLAQEGNNVNSEDRFGKSPLSYAAEHGHEAIVQLFLARKAININSKDKDGEPPLSYAAKNGHEAIVQLLLACEEIDINSQALSYAAKNGHEAVVKLLLAHEEIDINSQALSYAVENGHETIVQLLLAHREINVNFLDENGWPPLSYAAKNGHEAIVRLLLAREDIDINSQALLYAAKNGHGAIVQLLLAREEININFLDEDGQSPLSYAARNGRETIVRLLLAREEIDIDSQALSNAVRNRHKAVVQLLLAHEGINANTEDKDGRSPLSYAAQNGHESVAQLLLACEGANVNSEDKDRRSPLSYAVRYGSSKETVQLLLACEGINVNSEDKDKRSPLSYAAEHVFSGEIAQLLLGHEGINVNTEDKGGRSPLSYAAANGHKAIVELLLGHVGINANSEDKNGRSPLSFAAENGREAIVRLLLGHEGINANSQDKDGRSPLSYATENGYEAIVRLLLAHEDINAYSSAPISKPRNDI